MAVVDGVGGSPVGGERRCSNPSVAGSWEIGMIGVDGDQRKRE